MPLLNRHYVRPRLKRELIDISEQLHAENQQLKLSYLDANFPFMNGFPLLPHLSHDDGRKIDLSFYYTKEKESGNLKPSKSGYGAYVLPNSNASNQARHCKAQGYWQYDFSKYLTFGSREDLVFDLRSTKKLIELILTKPSTQKIFIEPHLKRRMNLFHDKVRFHGCQSVRHDDHIHYQIR